MPLGPGTRLGPYDVIAAIGAGGMGEVYRARDTKLNRDVALKILPAAFASDPNRLSRFHREAQVLASLNHPHIGAIYGFEDSGETHALVLEFVDGPTLADRIAQGSIPLDEALPIATQIAEALEAAHEQGIIHRDLKPANIKLKPDGTVKVLDFGLAKLAEPVGGGPSAVGTTVSMSPTITSPAMMTGVGVLLGTAAYMSPEQARGKAVDKRADIWAFGCVLFEMLTGSRAFEGHETPDVIVAVLSKEPDWSRLPSTISVPARTVLERCLVKDPRERLRDIGDARIELATSSIAPITHANTAVPPLTRRSALTVAVAVIAALAAGWKLWHVEPSVANAAHLIAPLPDGVTLPLGAEHPLVAVSPDGKRLVFVGAEHGTRRLYVRDLAAVAAQPIPGTEGAMDPFFAPDGTVSFFAGSSIRKVPLTGGAARLLHAATQTTVNRGATWLDATTLIYAASPNSGLSRGSGDEEHPGGMGEWSYVTRDITAAYAWPAALPSGAAVLLTAIAGNTPDESNINVLSVGDKAEHRLIGSGTSGRFSATGHVVFARGGSLYALPLDPKRLEASGPEAKLTDNVVVEPNGAAQFSVSANGVLAYIAGPPLTREHELVWVDRQGRPTVLRDDGREYSFPRLSPDGSKLAVSSPTGSNEDVWILDLRLGSLQRITTAPGEDFEPVWNPDGTRLAISSESPAEEGPGLAITRGPNFDLDFPLHTPGVGNWEMPTSWSPDGKWIAITRERARRATLK